MNIFLRKSGKNMDVYKIFTNIFRNGVRFENLYFSKVK